MGIREEREKLYQNWNNNGKDYKKKLREWTFLDVRSTKVYHIYVIFYHFVLLDHFLDK